MKRFGLTTKQAGGFARGFGALSKSRTRFGGGRIVGAPSIQMLFSDNFNRADGAVGNGWGLLNSTGTIATNQLSLSSSAWSAATQAIASQNAALSFVLAQLPGNGEFHLLARYNEVGQFGTYYRLNLISGNLILTNTINGTAGALSQTVAYAPQIGDILSLSCLGSLIKGTATRAGSEIANVSGTNTEIAGAGSWGVGQIPYAPPSTVVIDDVVISG